jgi:hypothetical protein
VSESVLIALLAADGVAADGEPRSVSLHADGRLVADEPITGVLYPGSFNPLHDGHRGLAAAVSEVAGAQVTCELAVLNVDKPPLDLAEVRRRMAPFRSEHRPLVLTTAPTFIEKARLFPGVTFAIGWDTAVRLVHARYYGGSQHALVAALAELRALDCHVLVAGRVVEDRFRRLDEAEIPPDFADLFTEIPESRFRVDLSSSELRPDGGG